MRLCLMAVVGLLFHCVSWASGPIWEQGGTKCLPNFRNDKPVGYLCVKVASGSVYQKVGLRAGDNVTEINNHSVVEALAGADGPDSVIDFWQEFERTDLGTLVVERGDKTLTLKKTGKSAR